ncbi:MAG: sigma-54-dependent Fis family transcriptional regulator [Kiritimatiellae bacterium]|nr:sigma-54-dependent Fis family transcriptional regulator [Kiritimatiellia bacterium]
MKPKILIVDDEKPLRDMLAKWFSAAYECFTAPDAEQAMKTVAAEPSLALLITDFKMPGENGLVLAKRAKAANPGLGVIILTAHADVDLVIEAMRDGVDDFFQKPITDLGQFESRVARAIKTAALEKEVSAPESRLDGELESFTGSSPAMQRIYRLIRKVAPTEANIFIEGPSGSGKELVARAVHNLSRRAKGPFVAVECAALPANLLETELFGSVKGAYTDARDRAGSFETADGGTIFLDEIGDIDQPTQVKLLRVLESRTFQRVGESVNRKSDFRLVTATNRNLLRLVADGTFREDLYYRLNVIDIRTPALKDHREDIAPLVSRFLKEFSAANGGAVTGIEPAALKKLEDYDWPGNVRQLRNVIEKMVVLASGDRLTADDLPAEIALPSTAPAQIAAPDGAGTLAENERLQIMAALDRCGNNKSRAADELGISRRTLHRKLKEWGKD